MAEKGSNTTRRLVANIDSDLVHRIKVEAAIRDTSMTHIIQQALSDWLELNASDLTAEMGSGDE